ncbi:hypothetical protein CB0940_09086 [Cercospora beticola]|uniref:Uncharacterized protein n=1 Tax=Cercospora beticola TaxID=122368 RepID=A0A2G5HG29_CERBT|nr:hypothetical protein CB0940_09086 [Cercospora beticola]PIA91491.1 hypothetical protein CB0940_09086 [Cercospora beticola]WPB06633.1 hypothetical protein RHO25_011290 [Cercospora beticola]
MTSTPAHSVPYLAAVQLADRAIQLQAEHQRAEAAWATEKSDFLNDRDRAEAAWEMERSDFLNERTRLLCEKVDLGIDKAVLYTANEKLKKEKADLRAIVEKLRAENIYLRTKEPLCKEPLHISAAHRVFAVPELLEQILLQVPHPLQEENHYCAPDDLWYFLERPVPQLFEMQRVNHQFAATIQGSSAVQRRVGLIEVLNGRDAEYSYDAYLEHPSYQADRSGLRLKSAATDPFQKLDSGLPSLETWPHDRLSLLGSWTRTKVNLKVTAAPKVLWDTCFFDGRWDITRRYEFWTERKTTWAEVVQWMVSIRKDYFERWMALQALSEISPDLFA